MRRRSFWIGAAILVAASAAAVPLWLSLDDESRTQAALTERTESEALDCERARDTEACAELNRLFIDLDRQLAEIDRLRQSVDRQQDAIQQNEEYLAATKNELAQQDMLMLQRLFEKKAQLEQMISNVMKAYADTQNSLAAALKAS
ncbi:MAG: hypothetical protein ACXWZ8_04040 [Gaiellaceae bacterium]